MGEEEFATPGSNAWYMDHYDPEGAGATPYRVQRWGVIVRRAGGRGSSPDEIEIFGFDDGEVHRFPVTSREYGVQTQYDPYTSYSNISLVEREYRQHLGNDPARRHLVEADPAFPGWLHAFEQDTGLTAEQVRQHFHERGIDIETGDDWALNWRARNWDR